MYCTAQFSSFTSVQIMHTSWIWSERHSFTISALVSYRYTLKRCHSTQDTLAMLVSDRKHHDHTSYSLLCMHTRLLSIQQSRNMKSWTPHQEVFSHLSQFVMWTSFSWLVDLKHPVGSSPPAFDPSSVHQSHFQTPRSPPSTNDRAFIRAPGIELSTVRLLVTPTSKSFK